MVAIYEETRTETARVSTRPSTMIVITWPATLEQPADALDTELSATRRAQDEDEPTWEDAAWV